MKKNLHPNLIWIGSVVVCTTLFAQEPKPVAASPTSEAVKQALANLETEKLKTELDRLATKAAERRKEAQEHIVKALTHRTVIQKSETESISVATAQKRIQLDLARAKLTVEMLELQTQANLRREAALATMSEYYSLRSNESQRQAEVCEAAALEADAETESLRLSTTKPLDGDEVKKRQAETKKKMEDAKLITTAKKTALAAAQTAAGAKATELGKKKEDAEIAQVKASQKADELATLIRDTTDGSGQSEGTANLLQSMPKE